MFWELLSIYSPVGIYAPTNNLTVVLYVVKMHEYSLKNL